MTNPFKNLRYYDEGVVHEDISVKTQVKLHPLEKIEDVGGHVFATCWEMIQPIREFWVEDPYNPRMKPLPKTIMKVFVCLKCKMELSSIAHTIRDARVPDSQPMDSCDEFELRFVLES